MIISVAAGILVATAMLHAARKKLVAAKSPSRR